MSYLHGITVTLYEKTETGTDAFNHPTYTETAVSVDNVLVGPASEMDISSTQPVDMASRKQEFALAIPKGDTHEWRNSRVSFISAGTTITALTVGDYQQGIEDYMPLDWHKKIRCEVING